VEQQQRTLFSLSFPFGEYEKGFLAAAVAVVSSSSSVFVVVLLPILSL